MGLISFFKDVYSEFKKSREEDKRRKEALEKFMNRDISDSFTKVSKTLFELSRSSSQYQRLSEIFEFRSKKLKRNLSMVSKELSRTKDALNAAEAHILALQNPELTSVHVNPSVLITCEDNAHLRVLTAYCLSFYKEEVKRRWWNKRYNPFRGK